MAFLTCHHWIGTPGFHSKIDLRPVRAPEPLRGDLRAATIGIKDRRRWMQGDHALCQVGPHVQRIEEPDKAKYAQADGDVDEDFADVNFLFLLFAVECRGLLVFPGRGNSLPSHHPLPLPAHPTLLKLEGKKNKRNVFFLISRAVSQKWKLLFFFRNDWKTFWKIKHNKHFQFIDYNYYL